MLNIFASGHPFAREPWPFRISAMLAGALTLAACTSSVENFSATSCPPDSELSDYLPLQLGNRWVYDYRKSYSAFQTSVLTVGTFEAEVTSASCHRGRASYVIRQRMEGIQIVSAPVRDTSDVSWFGQVTLREEPNNEILYRWLGSDHQGEEALQFDRYHPASTPDTLVIAEGFPLGTGLRLVGGQGVYRQSISRKGIGVGQLSSASITLREAHLVGSD